MNLESVEVEKSTVNARICSMYIALLALLLAHTKAMITLSSKEMAHLTITLFHLALIWHYTFIFSVAYCCF